MAKATLVTVLAENDYLQVNLRAVHAKPGDVIEIMGGPYTDRVIELGMVEYAAPAIAAEAEAPEEKAVEKGAAKAADPGDALIDEDPDPVGSLMEVNGIGQKTAVKLVNGGITSKRALVEADAVDVSEIASVTVAKIQGWQAEAARLLEA